MKKLIFDTKENNNQRREDEFLALTPHERFIAFLRMVQAHAKLHPMKENPNRQKNNFVVEKLKPNGV